MKGIKQMIAEYREGEIENLAGNLARVSKTFAPVPATETGNGRKPQPAITDRGFQHLSTLHMSPQLFISSGYNITINEKQLFEVAIVAAWNWNQERRGRPGLSFVLVSGAIPPMFQSVDQNGNEANIPTVIKDDNGRELPTDLFDGYGCGKTTIAEILYSSCKTAVVEEDVNGRKIAELQAAPDDDPALVYVSRQMNKSIDEARQELINAYQEQSKQNPPRSQTVYTGRFFTAADLMEKLAGGRDENGFGIDERAGAIIGENSEVVVIDDVGREGVLPYIAKESQMTEIQNRYYRAIDFVYRRFKNGHQCPSLVLTSNMRVDELKYFLGGANWTRLEEMCPADGAGYIHDLTGVRNYRLLPRLLGGGNVG